MCTRSGSISARALDTSHSFGGGALRRAAMTAFFRSRGRAQRGVLVLEPRVGERRILGCGAAQRLVQAQLDGPVQAVGVLRHVVQHALDYVGVEGLALRIALDLLLVDREQREHPAVLVVDDVDEGTHAVPPDAMHRA
jgi:hypothetical protein